MRAYFRYLTIVPSLILCAAAVAAGQNFEKRLSFSPGGTVEIINRYGRVDVKASGPAESDSEASITSSQILLSARSDKGVVAKDLVLDNGKSGGDRVYIEVQPEDTRKRIDITVEVPERCRVMVETTDGAVGVSGDLQRITALTGTGTIMVDVPTEDLKYDLLWTESRPRFLSDIELEKVKEKAAGKFLIHGSTLKTKKKKTDADADETAVADDPPTDPSADPKSELRPVKHETSDDTPSEDKKADKKKHRDRGDVRIELTTARGIILVNVPPNEVSSDLRERPLTNAAKAIIRSGDSMLMDAIRRASPKYFGDYAATLPPIKREPVFGVREDAGVDPGGSVKRILVSAIDINNRTISDLKADEFEVTENNKVREVVSVQPVTAPFNLVLLLDVSGSVENYMSFIRKAARAFVNTVGRDDRVAIVTFNDDTHVLSGFTTDKPKLSASLDTFEAGGATAYYDALAFTLADTLRPLKGERTAIVVLTDGDDNRSFLSFDSLLGSLQESGALVYPLYVPSGLVAASASDNTNSTPDPLRARYMGLSTKAEGEGARLAEVSGGVYYPITQLSQIQAAYDDIVRQLRTAYTVTFRSDAVTPPGKGVSPKVKVRVKRENAFVKMGTIAVVAH